MFLSSEDSGAEEDAACALDSRMYTEHIPSRTSSFEPQNEDFDGDGIREMERCNYYQCVAIQS